MIIFWCKNDSTLLHYNLISFNIVRNFLSGLKGAYLQFFNSPPPYFLTISTTPKRHPINQIFIKIPQKLTTSFTKSNNKLAFKNPYKLFNWNRKKKNHNKKLPSEHYRQRNLYGLEKEKKPKVISYQPIHKEWKKKHFTEKKNTGVEGGSLQEYKICAILRANQYSIPETFTLAT